LAGLWRPGSLRPEWRHRLQFRLERGAGRAQRLSAAGSRLKRMPKADATEWAPKKSACNPPATHCGRRSRLHVELRGEARTFLSVTCRCPAFLIRFLGHFAIGSSLRAP
jgi:hypothetical protein